MSADHIGILALLAAVAFSLAGTFIVWLFTRRRLELVAVWYYGEHADRMTVEKYDAGTYPRTPDAFEVWQISGPRNRRRLLQTFVSRYEAEGYIAQGGDL